MSIIILKINVIYYLLSVLSSMLGIAVPGDCPALEPWGERLSELHTVTFSAGSRDRI